MTAKSKAVRCACASCKNTAFPSKEPNQCGSRACPRCRRLGLTDRPSGCIASKPAPTFDCISDQFFCEDIAVRSTEVVIIGAGAAGLMCALTAAGRGRKVMLIDHANKAGKKILMSGGGRCKDRKSTRLNSSHLGI